MSEAAGGFVVVGAVAGGAALLAGATVFGAGYLLCKGGYRAIAGCKEKWEKHLDKLEQERQELLNRKNQEDQTLNKNLMDNLLLWTQFDPDQYQDQEKFLEQKKEEQFKLFLESQEKISDVSASWKRIELLDDELKQEFPQTTPEFDTFDKEAYQQKLEKAKIQLKKEVEQQESSLSNVQNLTFIPQLEPPTSRRSAGGHLHQLSALKVELAALFFLPVEQHESIKQAIAELENDLKHSHHDEPVLSNRLGELQARLKQARQENERRRVIWDECQDIYFRLYNRLSTAQKDQELSKIIETPLQELSEFLSKSKIELATPKIDLEKLKTSLQGYQPLFDQKVEQALLAHQDIINEQILGRISEALQELDYGAIEQKEAEEGRRLIGKKKIHDREATVFFHVNQEGYLSIDLSHEGFSNQAECSQEFFFIQQALQRKGLYINFDRHKTTWMTEMVDFLKNKLQEQGFSKENIIVEESVEGKRILAQSTPDTKTEINLDKKTGKWSQEYKSQEEEQKSRNRAFSGKIENDNGVNEREREKL